MYTRTCSQTAWVWVQFLRSAGRRPRVETGAELCGSKHLKLVYFGFLKLVNFGFLKLVNFGSLKLANFEFLKLANFGVPKLANFRSRS